MQNQSRRNPCHDDEHNNAKESHLATSPIWHCGKWGRLRSIPVLQSGLERTQGIQGAFQFLLFFGITVPVKYFPSTRNHSLFCCGNSLRTMLLSVSRMAARYRTLQSGCFRGRAVPFITNSKRARTKCRNGGGLKTNTHQVSAFRSALRPPDLRSAQTRELSL